MEIEKTKENSVDKKKKFIIKTALAILAIILVIITSLYIANSDFRMFMDKYIFRKEIEESNLPQIDINMEDNPSIYAYSDYIVVYGKNKLHFYTSIAKEEKVLDVEISNPVFASNDKYLLIADKGKQRMYLISNTDILWQQDIEGNISKINVNKNGYVSVIITGTSNKSVIATYDNTGKELFKTYLSKTIAVDTDISFDNKYLSFAQVNVSGNLVQSDIKTISIEKAKQTPSEAFINTYTQSDRLILNIKYQGNNKIVAFFQDGVILLNNNNEEEVISLSNKEQKINFTDIELDNAVCSIIEKNSGILTTIDEVNIINIDNKKASIYTIQGVTKNLYCYDDNIAINLGNEVHFVNLNGWLEKKYSSTQDIKSIVLGKNIAGIIYKDRIDVVSL